MKITQHASLRSLLHHRVSVRLKQEITEPARVKSAVLQATGLSVMAQGRGSMWHQTGVRWDQGDVWNRCGGHKSGVGARHWSGSWWCGKITNLRALDVEAWVRLWFR